MDFMFRQSGNQRHNCSDDMRSLKGAPKREFALDLVKRRYALAGFQWRGVGAVIDQHLFDGYFGVCKYSVGCVFVTDLPFENVVWMFAGAMRTNHLILDVLAQNRRVRQHRFERINDAGQCLVDHIHQFGGVGGDVTVLSDDKSHFLILEQHFFFCQNSLDVACQRRHVMQAKRLEICRGEHSYNAR